MNKFDPNTKNEILKEAKEKWMDWIMHTKDYGKGDQCIQFEAWLNSKLQEVERASFDKAADIVAQTLPEYTERSILLMTEPDRILAKEHNNKRKGLLAQLKGVHHE